MPDGPFRNQPLSSRARKFADEIYRQVESKDRCCAFAAHAILGLILKENKTLQDALERCKLTKQMGLDPSAEVTKVFDDHPKSQFSCLQEREINFCVSQNMPIAEAITSGTRSALREYVQLFELRMEEASLGSYHEGKMSKEECVEFSKNCKNTLNNLNEQRLLKAICNGNSMEFEQDVAKQTSVDAGPPLCAS